MDEINVQEHRGANNVLSVSAPPPTTETHFNQKNIYKINYTYNEKINNA